MVKGSPNIRSLFQAKESPTKPVYSTSPGRPPLSAFSASARNNLSAGNSSPAPSVSKSQPRIERCSPQAKTRRISSGQVSYPSSENAEFNVVSSSSNSSSPERYSTPCGTPWKTKSTRSSGLKRLPFSSTDLENEENSPGGAYEECRTRTTSSSRPGARSSEVETSNMDDSDSSSTSGSEVENVSLPRPSPARRQSAIYLSRESSARQEGLRRMSLGPKIEAAVSKLEKTPTKPSRPGRNGTPCASPGSLRSSARRSLVLHDQHQAQTHFELEEDPTFWDDHNVQVVIRTRPTSGKEAAMQDFSRCLRQDGPHAITWLGQPETRFTFDHVAGENISQEKMFKVVGLPIVENCLAGYNSCMFAYGQTGSGKTHTMLGDITNLGDRPNEYSGMTPRIFEYLFSRIHKEEQDRQLEQLRFVCKCSFLEIYNEQITDLLEPSSSNLQMREDSKKGVYVENLTEMVVSSVQEVMLLLQKGAANRKVASTNMNRESSRSHSVFTCIIESKWMTNSTGNMRFGRLNLVDLAGSERQKSSGAEGERLKEASSINKSLSTLGLVIMTLIDMANGKPRHVPYRDSKLTFLLQDSLGGNSKTAIIATISPSSCCSMETLSTLKFAQRAKFIQNNAVINEDASEEILALRREIQELKEEVSRLRSHTLSSMQRECRRASNEFFRMSIGGKDLFDAAEKKPSDEGLDLKSAELLGKVKALESVLAGALRREQVAESKAKQQFDETEKAYKLIEDRELEVMNCKGLLHQNADESAWHQPSEDVTSSDSKRHVMLADKLDIAKSLERNSAVSKLQLENFRLAEQVQRYRSFYDSGEKGIMEAEIQGLREQTLELLDGKIAVEQGLLSTTIAQGDSYRKELETCRNDLTNCLEASSQLQRQVSELQSLVNQLTERNSEKERELKQMKESAEKYASVAGGKDEEIKSLRSRWETATAALFHDLKEGERALVDAGKEMAEILGDDWLPKNTADVPARWSTESVKSLTEVDIEHDYFKRRDSSNSDDIFGDRKTSRKKKSFSVPPRLSNMIEEKMKLQVSVARLEQDLEEQKQRILKGEHMQEELNRLERENLRLVEEMEAVVTFSRNTAKIVEENVDLKIEVQHLQVKFLEQSDAITVSRAQMSALDKNLMDLEKIKLDQEEVLASKSLELSGLQEKNLELLNQISILSLDLNDFRIKVEESESTLDEIAQTNDKLIEENALLKFQAEKAAECQIRLNSKVSDLEAAVKKQQEEMSELEAEIERLETLLRDEECRQLQLENSLEGAVEHDQTTIALLEEVNENLDTETKMLSLKLASTDSVQEELCVTLSFLHAELEKKTKTIDELGLQAQAKADADARERNLSAAELISCQVQIGELNTALAANREFLRQSEKALLSATATCDGLKVDRDAAQARADLVQAEATSIRTKFQELREKLDLKSSELDILSALMVSVTAEQDMTHAVNCQSASQTLSHELEQECPTLLELEHQLLELTTTLEQNQADLSESRINENNLLAEVLNLKDNILRSESTLDSTRKAETRLRGELLVLSEIVESTNLENDFLKEELAAIEGVMLEHQSAITVKQEKIEANVQAITCLNDRLSETIEPLQMELQSKGDCLRGLEFEISLLKERAAENTDFNQVLLAANARIRELQEEAQSRCEDLKQLASAKSDIEAQLREQFSLRAAASKLVEDQLLEKERQAALASTESQTLNFRISQLQISLRAFEASLAEKDEELSSAKKELVAARDSMTTECIHETASSPSLQRGMKNFIAERDELQSQFSIQVQMPDYFEERVRQQVAHVEYLRKGQLVSMMSNMDENGARLDTDKDEHEAELALTIKIMKQLERECLKTSGTADQLNEEKVRLEASISDLQVDRDSLKSQLDQRIESENLLQEQILTISESAEQNLGEVNKLKSQIENLQSLNCRLEKDLTLKIEDVTSLGAEVMAARNLTAKSLEQVDEMRARICVMEEKHHDMENDIALENSAVNPEAAELSAATTFSIARDLDDLHRRVAMLVSDNDNLEKCNLQKDKAMSSMDADLMAMKGSLSSLESLTSKLADLQIQKSHDEAELQTARTNQIELQDEIHSLALRLADSEESNNTLKLELAENITAMSILQDRISIASRSFNYNHEEMKAMKAEIAALLIERDGLQAEVVHKLATISSLENELVGARAAAGSSKDRIAALETKVVVLQTERDSIDKQITELEADVISTLQIELTEAQKSLKSLDNEMAEARRVSDCVLDENSALQAQVVALEAQIGALQAETFSKTTLIISLEAELAAASSSSMALREDLKALESQVLEFQNLKATLGTEVAEIRTSIGPRESEIIFTYPTASSKVYENDEMRMQIGTSQEKCSAVEAQIADANQEMDIMKAQIAQQELQLSSLEELLAQKAEALQHVVSKVVHATKECEKVRSEVEDLKETLRLKETKIKEQEKMLTSLEIRMPLIGDGSDEIRAIKDERDQALVEVQALHGELRAAQLLVASHKSSVLEAQKFAEANILRASGKEEEARTLKASVSALKNQSSALEKQLEDAKREVDTLRKARDELEMELQGMKNRMTMLQAVHSTGSRNFKGFQAAQAASLDLQKTLEDKETEFSQMYKRMTVLHSQNEVQASRLEEMESELAHVHQELDDLHSQCEDKDAQLRALNGQLKEAETLTQDVMRDLHNVKLDISNYASLVSQQQLELISERARHSDEAREKDEELSNLQTQLNQERQNWMMEMNHKQAEIVVARVLSEKMRLKNKSLAAEYKRLKADYGGKKKKLKILEQQLTQLTTDTHRFSIGTESEADFDEVKQFQALLAQANDHERAQRK